MKLQYLLAVCDYVLSLSKDGPVERVLGPLFSHLPDKFLLSISLPYWVQFIPLVSKPSWLSSSSLASLTQIIALNAGSYFLLSDHKLFIPCLLFFFTQNDIPENRGGLLVP